jgi:hypothetical protein
MTFIHNLGRIVGLSLWGVLGQEIWNTKQASLSRHSSMSIQFNRRSLQRGASGYVFAIPSNNLSSSTVCARDQAESLFIIYTRSYFDGGVKCLQIEIEEFITQTVTIPSLLWNVNLYSTDLSSILKYEISWKKNDVEKIWNKFRINGTYKHIGDVAINHYAIKKCYSTTLKIKETNYNNFIYFLLKYFQVLSILQGAAS